jgi:hypothetical protein
MRIKINGCLRVVFAMAVVWLLCSSINTTASQQVRQMGHQNIPIEERLLPGDEIVEMEIVQRVVTDLRSRGAPFCYEPTTRGEVQSKLAIVTPR